MSRKYVGWTMAALCSLGLSACDGTSPTDSDLVTLKLERLADGDLQYCEDATDSADCQTLPYDGDCVVVEVDVDLATGATCQRCILADGTVRDMGCDDTLIGCVLVTLPEPDCVVCAYVNGAIIFSSCTVDDQPECFTDRDCISADGRVGFCFEGMCVYDQGCTSDADCPPGYACAYPVDPATGTGGSEPGNAGGATDMPAQGCSSDEDCFDGSRCLNGICEGGGVIPPPQPWYGTCVPRDIPCASDLDCPSDMYCETWCYATDPAGPETDCSGSDPNVDCMPPPCEGVCRPHFNNPCERVECRPGEHCEVQYVECFAYPCEPIAVCVPDQRPCLSDEECGPGFICEASVCPAMPCTPDYCPPCYGICVPVDPTYCYADSDCPPDQICQFDATTRPACDPAAGSNCDETGLWAPGVCVPKPFVCTSDRDCDFGYCVDGVCQSRFDCDQSHAFCDMIPPLCGPGLVPSVINGCWGPCVLPEFCLPVQIECLANEDCPAGHECLMYCTSSCDNGSSECFDYCGGVCVPVAPLCNSDFECLDPSGVAGKCINGVCVFEPSFCLSNEECAQGEICDFSQCNGGGVPCDPNGTNCGDRPIQCTGVCVPAPSPCVRGGCSGEFCVPAGSDIASICIWLEEYICYQDATCEPQADGQCGWTQTEELRACLERY
jgi:hypothetical protein